jgi:hypothetical protein
VALWPLAKATVTRSACPKAMFGCDLAEVYYTNRVDGELYAGINEKPFISPSSGEDYVSRVAPTSTSPVFQDVTLARVLCVSTVMAALPRILSSGMRVLIRNTEHCRASLSLVVAYHFSTCSTVVMRHSKELCHSRSIVILRS